MKKRNLMRLAVLTLCLSVSSVSLLGGTLAKYTSTGSVSDAVNVAKWSIKVDNKDIAKSEAITFQLFQTISDVGETEDDENVTDRLLAPGTQGSFAMNIENASEVTAKYTVELSVENANNIPLQYSVDDGTTWVDDIKNLNMDNLTDQEISINGTDTTNTIHWRWPFTDTASSSSTTNRDEFDTTLGTYDDNAPSVEITATITATQVD